MTLALSSFGSLSQFFDNSGTPLSAGKLQFCQAGSFTTNQDTWTTSAGTVLNSNPIILDSAGRLQSDVWVTVDKAYNIILLSSDNVILDNVDNVLISSSSVSTAALTAETATSAQGQQLFNLNNPYNVGSNALQVSVNGAVQVVGIDYTETSSSSVTFTSGLNAGDVVLFKTFATTVLAAIGSGSVTYSQGAAGSVSHSVFSKLQEWISVEDFGASVTASAAINNAAFVAALAASDAVFVPRKYTITGNLNVKNKTLFGVDKRISGVKLTGANTNIPIFVNGANSSSAWGSGGGVILRNLDIEGNWDGSTANSVAELSGFDSLGSLIKWYAGAYVDIQHCQIHNGFAHAIASWNLGYSQIQFNEINTCKYSGVYLYGVSSGNAITSTWISNNSIHSVRGTACIYVREALTCQITQNVFEDATNGFYSDGNDNRAVSFMFNDMEQMSSSGVNIQGSGTQYKITNNFLGVTTPITIANSPADRQGEFHSNTFASQNYQTSYPTLGSGNTLDNAIDIFGSAVTNASPGVIKFRTNNNSNASTSIVELLAIHTGTVNEVGGALLIRSTLPSTGVKSDQIWVDSSGNLYPDRNEVQSLGKSTNRFNQTHTQVLALKDNATAPTAVVGTTFIYVDAADGDLKVRFGDGVTKTITVDT